MTQANTSSAAAPTSNPTETVEVVTRSINLTFDFARAIVDDPNILDDVPEGAIVVLIPADDPELAAVEVEEGLAALRQGWDVYFRHVRPGDRAR